MTAVAPAFHSVIHTAGRNLNYRKCCWVHYGSEGRESLLRWLSDNCEDCCEMQVVRYAKYVGTMIGPDGQANGKKKPARTEHQRLYQKSGRETVRSQNLCGVCVELHWLRMCTCRAVQCYTY